MKKLLIASTIVLSTGVMAHSDTHIQISSSECQVDFQNDVRITPTEVEITNSGNQRLIIDDNGSLMINGQAVDLTSSQQEALTQYADSLRVQLPQVASIALDGVELAGVALDEVAHTFNLHGLDSLNSLMDELHVEINDTFYQQGAFVMGEQTFNEFGENFESKFEHHIEEAVESAMMESIGSILMAIGSEMVSSGGNMKDFEQRMENMGKEIEQKVELQAKNIEQKADALCGQFAVLASTESSLQSEIPALANYQLFNYKAN